MIKSRSDDAVSLKMRQRRRRGTSRAGMTMVRSTTGAVSNRARHCRQVVEEAELGVLGRP